MREEECEVVIGVEGRRGRGIKGVGIIDKTYKSRVVSCSIISYFFIFILLFYLKVEGERGVGGEWRRWREVKRDGRHD